MIPKFKKTRQSLLSTVMALALPFSMVASTVVVETDAADVNEGNTKTSVTLDNGVKIDEEADSSGTTAISQYSPDSVETSLLIPHTGQSSELDGGDALKLVEEGQKDFDNNFITLSCEKSFYDSLGFNSDEMSETAKKYATSKEYQNPMSGYKFRSE